VWSTRKVVSWFAWKIRVSSRRWIPRNNSTRQQVRCSQEHLHISSFLCDQQLLRWTKPAQSIFQRYCCIIRYCWTCRYIILQIISSWKASRRVLLQLGMVLCLVHLISIIQGIISNSCIKDSWTHRIWITPVWLLMLQIVGLITMEITLLTTHRTVVIQAERYSPRIIISRITILHNIMRYSRVCQRPDINSSSSNSNNNHSIRI